jgi:heterodisulfide reductase subunit A-like polyferredoxin/coenzyme F420-reducing hydrogenase delta subunit
MKTENRDIAVVLCDCGQTLRDRLDFDRLQKHLTQLPEVATVKLTSKFCRQNECNKLIKSLEKKQTHRLVIGACDKEIFDKNLSEVMETQALNEGLLWCVNIREHCSWVANTPKEATDRATDILNAAVRRSKQASPLESKKIRASQNVLVLGSGVAAMQTAAALSQLGHHVILAGTSKKLGGLAAQNPKLYAYVAPDYSDAEALVKERVDELIGQVSNDKKISVHTAASVKSVDGELGNFTAVINSKSKEQNVTVGAIVLAVGASATNSDLLQLVHLSRDIPKRVAIVADILGEQTRAVSAQMLSAAELLEKRFATKVTLYCHNIRVAATGLERLYRRAREAGVVIVKYDSPPIISDKGSKKVLSIQEPVLGKEISEDFDMIIMADTPLVHGNSELTTLIEGLRAGPENALQYDNVWLLPTKTNRDGIFVAGSARSNSEFRDAQNDGLATASQIHELLKNKQIEVLNDAAVVDSNKCVLCLTCMRICPHAAVGIDTENKTASISLLTCQRCGICAAQCPAAAIELPRYTDAQVEADIGIEPKTQSPKLKTVVFACENSAYPAATAAAANGSTWLREARLIRVPCAGKVDARDVLRSLESGAQKVIILACHLENCQYLAGSTRAEKRIQKLNRELEKAGVDKKQVLFKQLASVEPSKFLECVKE